MAFTSLPDNLRGVRQRIQVNSVDWSDDRARKADLEALDDLSDSISRNGLLQPIGVKRKGARFELIWGRRRLEVYRSSPDGFGFEIEAVVYPEDLPLEWAKILEIDENARRQDLTPDERAAHAVELAAEIKKIESQVQPGKPDLSGFTSRRAATTAPTTGRGHKGIVQKVAELQKVDQAAVRKRAQKVADTIGEPVDLQQDSPAELTRKAAEFREVAKGPRKPRAKAEDARTTGTYAVGKYKHRYEVPQKHDPKIDTAWLMHAPAADVAMWWKDRGSQARLRAIVAALDQLG